MGLAILLFQLVSCELPSTQIKFCTLSNAVWQNINPVELKVDSIMETRDYQLSVILRTSASSPYPFKDLIVKVTQQWCADSLSRIDTVACELFPDHTGVRTNGVSVFTLSVPFDTVHLAKGDSGTITLTHLMRRSDLPGIEDVGVSLE